MWLARASRLVLVRHSVERVDFCLVLPKPCRHKHLFVKKLLHSNSKRSLKAGKRNLDHLKQRFGPPFEKGSSAARTQGSCLVSHITHRKIVSIHRLFINALLSGSLRGSHHAGSCIQDTRAQCSRRVSHHAQVLECTTAFGRIYAPKTVRRTVFDSIFYCLLIVTPEPWPRQGRTASWPCARHTLPAANPAPAMLHRAQGCGVSTTASLQPVESGLGHPCDAAPTA
mmetsp:Transcript_116044/g.225853  ORF Transcript_116044/g.225853 Transcript_116044/m.225853 type:complete len:226 (+) Transcript_116044:442-1119(+)